jgi:hypothetical protein
MTYRIREGETGNQDFTLYDENGAYNGAGASIALVLKDRSQGLVDMSGSKVAWISAAAGTVRVQPAAGDLLAERSPYTAAFIVTVSGATYSFPKDEPDIWKVWK